MLFKYANSCRQDSKTPVLHWDQLREKAMSAGIADQKEVYKVKHLFSLKFTFNIYVHKNVKSHE